jgi:protein-S-isoprenylcysteine O-methyltransferase Ste14
MNRGLVKAIIVLPGTVLVEEKSLKKRFGDNYRLYKKNVPRWIPRVRPWISDKNGS